MFKYSKKLTAIFITAIFAAGAFAFEEGFVWGLRANFFGALTIPSISQEDLDTISAAYMRGGMGFHIDGEADLGYIFGTERWFPSLHGSLFSGLSAYGSIGIGTGGVNEIAGNTISGNTVDMFVNVDYMPVITFGAGTKAYFLENRISTGVWLGTKMIADMSPSYLAYASDTSLTNLPEIGEIIVDEWMMSNMNPFSFSMRGCFEYHQPVNDNVRVTLGVFGRFNIFSPKYLTMPDTLFNMMNTQLQKDGKPEFTKQTPLNSFYLNSLDFGVSLGLTFRGSVYKKR